MSPMKRKTKGAALEDLAELQRQAREAERRVQAADAERASSARWLPRAQTNLADYITATELGHRDRDPAVERELRDEVTDLQSMSVEIGRRGDSIQYADKRAVNRVEDARVAAQDAQSAVHEYIVEHRVELQVEMGQRALDARDQLLAAVENLSAAMGNWSAVSRDWRQMMERWPDMSPAEIPGHPLPAMQDVDLVAQQVLGGAKDPRGFTPMPVRLHPDTDNPDEVIYPGSLRGWAHVPRVVSSAEGLGA